MYNYFLFSVQGRGAKRGQDLTMCTSDQLKKLITLVKGDIVLFEQVDQEKEGSVLTVDRFKRELYVEVEDQCLTIPIHLLKFNGK